MRTSMILAVALLGLAACHCAGGAAKTGTERPVAANDDPVKYDLVQDKEVSVGKGVKVTLKTGLYAHLADSKNESLLSLEARRGDETKNVTLERVTPGAPNYTDVFGLQMAVDYVDPYHQPLTGAVLVR